MNPNRLQRMVRCAARPERERLGPVRWISGIALAVTAASSWAAVPDLLCQELKVVLVNPVTLRTAEVKESRTLYRFKAGDLYLSSPDLSEYRYNKVMQEEPTRYSAGHKTMLFENDFKRATFVHVYTDEIRISHVSCNRDLTAR